MQKDKKSMIRLRKASPEDAMDMTSMVDVTFLLLIFFMVSASFPMQKSIKMPRQQTDLPSKSELRHPPVEPRMVEVEIDKSGTILVMEPSWQRETLGKQSLVTTLSGAIESESSGMRLADKVHELARLQALVEALDAGTIAGFKTVEVTQFDDFN
jgi:biopolymer transport protein ExbD